MHHLAGKHNLKADSLSRIRIDAQSQAEFLGMVSATEIDPDEWTKDRIRSEQNKDPNLAPIIAFLSGNTRNRSELQLNEPISSYFMSNDSLLYHVSEGRTKTRPFVDQLVVPDPMKRFIISQFHDTLWSGHLKFEKTLQKIRLQYFWRHMYTDENSMFLLVKLAWNGVHTNTGNALLYNGRCFLCAPCISVVLIW